MTVTPKFRLTLPTYNVPGWDDDVNTNFNVIDAILGQYTQLLNVVGVWTNSTAYVVLNQVIDSVDSSIWQCAVNHTSPATGVMSASRTANPTYWTNISALATSAAASAAAAAASATVTAANATAAAASSTAATASASAATTSSTAASASAVAAATAASGVSAIGNDRNAVINGNMEIWQRATSFTVAAGTATWTADRWRCSHDGAGGTTTSAKQDLLGVAGNTPLLNLGIRHGMRYACTVVAAGQTFRQMITQIEGAETFSGRTVTVSFWATLVAGSGAFSVLLFQNFGTGGAPSATVNGASAGFTATGTQTKFSFTAALASVYGKSFGSNGNDYLGISFNFPLAATHTIDFANVQIELGTLASDTFYRPYGTELMLCERYCQVGQFAGSFSSTSGHAVGVSGGLKTTMRTTPTVNTITSSTITNVTGGALSVTADLVNYGGSATASAATTINVTYRVEAELSP